MKKGNDEITWVRGQLSDAFVEISKTHSRVRVLEEEIITIQTDVMTLLHSPDEEKKMSVREKYNG